MKAKRNRQASVREVSLALPHRSRWQGRRLAEHRQGRHATCEKGETMKAKLLKQKPRAKKTRRPAVACPHCSGTLSDVIRVTPRNGNLQRIRECVGCCRKFVTTESTSKSVIGNNSLVTSITALIRSADLSPKLQTTSLLLPPKEKTP